MRKSPVTAGLAAERKLIHEHHAKTSERFRSRFFMNGDQMSDAINVISCEKVATNILKRFKIVETVVDLTKWLLKIMVLTRMASGLVWCFARLSKIGLFLGGSKERRNLSFTLRCLSSFAPWSLR
ncbi:hypothetical protein SU32_10680 [Ahrensia marina]|uniref:Uncharacterized protein n=1 Tax=Ahrensia marina TaxID=1514904 RepID=A0A0M9GM94_9HYPH|nr:hypothetical protein SU32_10680 [Ahrensia marina]